MKKFTVHVTTGFQGADRECEIEVEDDATEAQIEEDARDAMFSMIEWSWWPLDPERKRR
jgi:hypothetical protein